MKRFVDYPLKDIRDTSSIERPGVCGNKAADHLLLASWITKRRFGISLGGTDSQSYRGTFIE